MHWHFWLGIVLSSSVASAQTPSPPNQVRWTSWSTASERRSGVDHDTAQSLPAPFQLTPNEKADTDRVLARWEKWNSHLKTFDCQFKRWTYDVVFGPAGQPKFVGYGVLKYASPNCAMFRVDSTEEDGRKIAIEDAHAEHWISDGKSIFEFNSGKKQLIEHRLPAEIAGRRLIDGPLAFNFVGVLFQKFLFGGSTWPCPFAATARQLREDYHIRKIASPNQNGEVRLEAFPRTRHVACMLNRLELILAIPEMSPVAVKIVQPNGRDYTVYQFFNIVVDDPSSRNPKAPFRPTVPLGWKKVVEESPAMQASRLDDDGEQPREQFSQPCSNRSVGRRWFSKRQRCLAAGGATAQAARLTTRADVPSVAKHGSIFPRNSQSERLLGPRFQWACEFPENNAVPRVNMPYRIKKRRFLRTQ